LRIIITAFGRGLLSGGVAKSHLTFVKLLQRLKNFCIKTLMISNVRDAPRVIQQRQRKTHSIDNVEKLSAKLKAD
jgi:hypothetical protein